MEQSIIILFSIFSILIGIYLFYRYIEASKIAKLMEKKKSLFTNGNEKIKNRPFFLVSSCVILFLSIGVAVKSIDSVKTDSVSPEVGLQVKSGEDNNESIEAYGLDRVASEEYSKTLPNEIEECKLTNDEDSTEKILDLANSLLDQSVPEKFNAMNAVNLSQDDFGEEAIANYTIDGQEINIYHENNEYYVEIRQVYLLEETDSNEE